MGIAIRNQTKYITDISKIIVRLGKKKNTLKNYLYTIISEHRVSLKHEDYSMIKEISLNKSFTT